MELNELRIRAIKDAVWSECEGFELTDNEASRILSAIDSLPRASDATVAESSEATAYRTLQKVMGWTDEDWSELFERYPAVRERALKQAAQQQAEPGADERAADAYVVMGYGETNLPQVSVVYGAGAAKAAVIGMIYSPSTDCPQDQREEYLHGFDEPANWSHGEWEGLTFEIGGVRVWRADVSVAAQSGQRAGVEPFVVKHYVETERPIVKGNGFDGLEVGEDREEAERFISFVNRHIAAPTQREKP